ncbi:MAG: KH domain-containing protein [Clostridia bacterium]|nr:KH domain-containing protein [Clostridia bacterium]
MKSIEVQGKTVDQAIEIGLYKLETTRENVKIAILEEAGLFNKARVRLTLAGEESQKETALKELVEEMLSKMNISCEIYIEERDEEFFVDITGEDAALLIGKRGDNLDATQYLISQIFNKGVPHDEYKKVVVDSAGYKKKREETLKGLARRTAAKVARENRNVALEPMNAFERRIIHSELSDHAKVETESRGNEPHRYVVIKLKGKAENKDKRKEKSEQNKEEQSKEAPRAYAD